MPFDFDAAVVAPFRMQPGLRRLAPGQPHLVPAAPGGRHMREKLAVLSALSHQALRCEAGFDPTPALHHLAAQAAAEHPGHFEWRDGVARALGVTLRGDELIGTARGVFGHGDEVPRCIQALPGPWRLAGLMALAFENDLAIIDGAQARVPWMAVALPSHWAPNRKDGLHFRELHGPVADGATLRAAGGHLMALVSGSDAYERFVWTITAHPRLNAHPDHLEPEPWRAAVDADAVRRQAWFRTERQTFLPLPQRREAVFTIHVQVRSLHEATADAARAQRLHDAVASMSPAVLQYRNLQVVREPLLAYLNQRAKESGSA